MAEDYVVIGAVIVITAGLVVLGSFLVRYRQLVLEANKSTQLAKDVWDSMNSRLSVMDTRIIDLMAKVEVFSTRPGPRAVNQPPSAAMLSPSSVAAARVERRAAESRPVVAVVESGSRDTERRVLAMLADGPKTSAEIKTALGKSREHTARLLKTLFDRGLLVRNDSNRPYVYEITDAGRVHLGS